MVLGQSAATAAVLALNEKRAVQDVPYEQLKGRLLADKQVLTFTAKPTGLDPAKLPGIVVDDESAERVGFETVSSSLSPFVGMGYRHDGAKNPGQQSAKFVPDLPAEGRYEIRIAYTASSNRSMKVPVDIRHAEGMKSLFVNQRISPPIDKIWLSLGTFAFVKGKAGSVTIRNSDEPGYVVIDAVQWLAVKK